MQNLAAPGAVAQDATAGHAARLFVTEIFEAKQEVASSCYKTCADYGGDEDCRKRGLIATVPELLLRVCEGVAR
jgi:hypothetical protein